MLAYHGSEEIKQKYIGRVKAHREADRLIKGTYWSDGATSDDDPVFRGCAVGCTVETSDDPHGQMQKELGVPLRLAYLEDRIFESLADPDHLAWPEAFLSSIVPGSDLALVPERFAHWALMDGKFGAHSSAKGDDAKAAVKLVADLFQRVIDGGKVTQEEWLAARDHADKARHEAWKRYRAAAYAYAAYAAAAYAAAAYAYADAYADAAYADAYADADADADADAARTAWWKAASEKLLELIKAAPMGVAA